MADIKALFAADGALAQAVRDYQPRPGQQELAEAVADNVSDDGILLAEAGTGTGKTFAYLLPLLASGKKGLVSTATRNLQEQIFTKDLPLVRKVLRSTARVALLKGRRNYLCHHHYHQYLDSEPHTAEEKAWRRAIERFFDKTADGDLVALTEIPEDAPVLARITSTAENCLGRDCAFFEECFVQQARQKAKEADVTIINHHLLLADFALKSEGFAEILPDIQAFVIDEAHHLPLTAIHFLGDRLSARQLLGFISDGEAAALAEAPDALELRETLRELKLQHSKILLAVRQPTETRLDEEQLFAHRAFWTELQALAALFELLHIQLAPQKARGKLLAHLDGRCQDLQKLLAAFLAEDRAALPAATEKTGDDADEAVAAYVHAFPEAGGGEQYGAFVAAEVGEQYVFSGAALYQQVVVGVAQGAFGGVQRLVAGKQQEGAAAAAFQYGQDGADEGVVVARVVRVGQAGRVVEQRLVAEVERAL